MDRTYRDDVEVGVGTKNGSVLVCCTDGVVRGNLASVIREDYPVRTADSESDALESIDRNVAVLVLDDADDEFSIDRILDARAERDRRFQTAAIVSREPGQSLRQRFDGVVEKPVDDRELRSTVRWLHRRDQYDGALGAYYALSKEYASLATDPDADVTELQSLEKRLLQLRAELDDIGDTLDDEDAFQVALGTDRDLSA